MVGLEMDKRSSEGYVRENKLEAANFILNTGYESFTQLPVAVMARLKKAIERQLPMLCVNPDIEVVRQSGQRILCAGHLAKSYEALGGEVVYVGKPHPLVYEHCLAHFSAVPKERILAVGDSLSTDIKGANSAGLDSLLITGGILKQRLGEAVEPVAVETLCRERGVLPGYVLPEFVW